MTRLFRRLAQWLIRLLLRVGLFPSSTRTDSDTMGEWKRLQAEKDDPKPGLVLPDPNAPHAELIRRVRLYAQHGAKALAPLLDKPLPDDASGGESSLCAILEHLDEADAMEDEAEAIMRECYDSVRGVWLVADVRALHSAYNSPWTVIDGEVYEYESETRRRVVQ